jgi:5-methylcytosine-specific restriction endonuclease McrA
VKRSGPIKRYTSIRRRKHPEVRVGKVSGKIRLSGQALEQLRERVYRRDRGRCQWKGCGVLLPLYGSVFTRGHAAHIVGRGAGGSDIAENMRLLCPHHHLDAEHTKGLKD